MLEFFRRAYKKLLKSVTRLNDFHIDFHHFISICTIFYFVPLDLGFVLLDESNSQKSVGVAMTSDLRQRQLLQNGGGNLPPWIHASLACTQRSNSLICTSLCPDYFNIIMPVLLLSRSGWAMLTEAGYVLPKIQDKP